MRRINIVVSCTNSKRGIVPSELHLRNYRGSGSLEAAADQWIRVTERPELARVPARDLYKGGYWSVVRSFQQPGDSWEIQVWICSAGYGLLSSSDPISPYAATFSYDHEDSVNQLAPALKPRAALRAWWKSIAARSSRPVRTLSDLASRDADVPLLIALSGNYLAAIEEDFLDLVSRTRPDQVAIVSCSSAPSQAQEQFRLPSDERLQTVVAGAKTSINARLVSLAMDKVRANGSFSRAQLSEQFAELLTRTPLPAKPSRVPKSDQEVEEFVARALVREPNASKSMLLRRFRDSGFACEQHRFSRLYADAKAKTVCGWESSPGPKFHEVLFP